MRLVDALKDGRLSWDDLNPYEENTKEFEVGSWIIRRESHELQGFSGKAYSVELLDSNLNPSDSYSWFSWDEVNSLKKLKEIVDIDEEDSNE